MKSMIKTTSFYAYLRKLKYRLNRFRRKSSKKLELADLKEIMADELGVCQGASVFVHCGFGFLNANFLPSELINLIKELVGRNGNIVMPFYPPGLSVDWLKSGREFKAVEIKCSTGVLSQAFSKSKGVYISRHPIKAVCVWGKDAEDLTKGHENISYPYGEGSPYKKLADIKGSLSIGLGVRNCAMVHCAEDLYESDKSYLYANAFLPSVVIDNERKYIVNSFYHHGLDKLNKPHILLDDECSDLLALYPKSNPSFYSIENKKMLECLKTSFLNGRNRRSK